MKMDETKLHLKEWLIVQIESGIYEGLCWEDEEKTMFRIPWKHAAKKDYNQTEDAALFKAWAVYKGKYKEGRDKADPTMWKTRLRCALNKSSDFQEVPDRNQLDITEPYKVYRIQQENEQTTLAESAKTKHHLKQSPRSPVYSDRQFQYVKEEVEAKKGENATTEELMMEHTYCEFKGKTNQRKFVATTFFSPFPNITDFRLQVKLLYHGQMVMKAVTTSPDGCFILQGRVPVGNEQIYGPCSTQQLSFPSPASVSLPSSMTEAMTRLLCHLERGVLLWVAPDGVFIKRFCQGRVFWSGPMAQYTDRPNKLEREKTFKLLDTTNFFNELQNYSQKKGPTPFYEIELCFGEEYPDPNVPKTTKLIMAQVVPLFALEVLQQFHLDEAEDKHQTLSPKTEESKMSED